MVHTSPEKYAHLCEVDNEAKKEKERAWKQYTDYRSRNRMSLQEEMEMQEEMGLFDEEGEKNEPEED